MEYFAKVKLKYSETTPIHHVAVKTWGETLQDAKFNVEQMVNTWQGLADFEVLKITRQPIHLTKFVVSGAVNYQNNRTNLIKLNIAAENREEAEQIFYEIIDSWRRVVSRQVLEISYHD